MEYRGFAVLDKANNERKLKVYFLNYCLMYLAKLKVLM